MSKTGQITTSNGTQPAPGARRLVPLAVALLVFAVVAAATLAIRASNRPQVGGGGTPVLRLSTTETMAASQAGPATSGGSGAYVLTGRLPAGRPGSAPIYRFAGNRPSIDAVRRLAGALGLAGTPTRDTDRWWLVSGSRELTILDGPGWPWQLDTFVGRMIPLTGCVPVPCPGSTASDNPTDPVRGLRAPTITTAELAATKVLTAVGQPTAALRTTVQGHVVQVRAPRRVAGLETADLGSVFDVGGDDRVQSGTGWLGAQPKAGPSYPLVGAAEAFRRLQSHSGPLSMGCPSGCPVPTPGSAPQQITGARLGLMVSTDERGSLLVPAWLFTLAGRPLPIPVLAVESRYLGQPTGPITPSSSAALPGSVPPMPPKK